MWFLALMLIYAVADDPISAAIEKAQSLALKKNRTEACAVLRRASNEAPARARARLHEAWKQIANVFFTDKGQKTFEASQAAMWDAPDVALSQFREALKLEDQNLQILNNLARIQILKQDCDGALQTLSDARKVYPSGESAVLELRALLCKSNFEALREKAKTLPPLDKWQEGYVQYLLAADALQQKLAKKSFDILTKLGQEHPQFPEAQWLLSRAALELGKDNEEYLQKYISQCKAVTAREKKRFSLEPRLCHNLKEAEDDLAKQQDT